MRDLRRILKKYGIENEELVRHLFGFVSFTSMEVVLIEDLAPDVLGKLGGHKVDVVRDLNPEIETSSSSPPLLE